MTLIVDADTVTDLRLTGDHYCDVDLRDRFIRLFGEFVVPRWYLLLIDVVGPQAICIVDYLLILLL